MGEFHKFISIFILCMLIACTSPVILMVKDKTEYKRIVKFVLCMAISFVGIIGFAYFLGFLLQKNTVVKLVF